MYYRNSNRSKACTNFKSINQDILTNFKNKSLTKNCKECVYFSSRNCGMDVADNIDPTIDFFC